MAKIIGDLELYMGPKETGGPDDLLATIVDGFDRKIVFSVWFLDHCFFKAMIDKFLLLDEERRSRSKSYKCLT